MSLDAKTIAEMDAALNGASSGNDGEIDIKAMDAVLNGDAPPAAQTTPANPMGDATPADVIRNAAMGRVDRGQADAFLQSVGMDPSAIDNFGKQEQSPGQKILGGAEQLLSGALSNFGDEAAAGMAAVPAAAASQLTNTPLSISDAFNAALQGVRTNQDSFQKQNPGTTAGLKLGGTLAQFAALRGAPGEVANAAAKSPLTMRALALFKPSSGIGKVVASTAVGAGTGAATGAVQGAGEGETADMRNAMAGDQAQTGAIVGGALGAAAPAVAGTAKALTRPMKKDFSGKLLGEGADSVDDVGKFAHVQRKLSDKYGELTAAENAAWDGVRKQAAGKGVAPKSIQPLQQKVMDAQATLTDNDAAGVVDRILTRWNRFAEAGEQIPAEELIANRSTLSKASAKNAGLRPIVGEVETQLKNLGIDVDKAVGLTKKRFAEFDDIAPIASALGENATAADFGKAVFGSGSVANATKAAQRVKEVMRAAGSDHADVKQALDQAVVHRILQTSSNGGEETVWIGKAAREINNLRQKNPEMWNMLGKDTQEGLSKLRDQMLKADKSGKIQMASQGLLWAANKILMPIGAKQTVRFPSTTGLQSTVDFKTIKELMKLRPDEGRSALDALMGKGK
jgi:hypothetical protein